MVIDVCYTGEIMVTQEIPDSSWILITQEIPDSSWILDPNNT